jgi:hypothetical protein
MKRLFVSVTTMALLGTLNLQAAPQTNLVQSLHFNLTLYTQGGPVTNQNLVSYSMTPRKVFTPDIIQVIGTSMSLSFSAKATLLSVTPLSGAASTIVIQDGTNRVDVTGFFNVNKDNVAVDSGVFEPSTGAQRGTECVNRSFRLRNRGGFPNLTLNFNVTGLSQTKYRSLFNDQGSVLGVAEEYGMATAGTAQQNGVEATVRGTVANLGRTVEVQ